MHPQSKPSKMRWVLSVRVLQNRDPAAQSLYEVVVVVVVVVLSVRVLLNRDPGAQSLYEATQGSSRDKVSGAIPQCTVTHSGPLLVGFEVVIFVH